MKIYDFFFENSEIMSIKKQTNLDKSLMNRDELLKLEDTELIKLCEIDFFKATGPGGQKKNKTESAVRLTLRDLGISATASEDRQQSVNRARAIKRLRLQVALELREPASMWNGQWDMNPKNSLYPLFAACLLDHLEDNNWQVSEAAKALELSTGKLIKLLAKSDTLWQHANRQRQKSNLKPLKR